MEGRFQRQPQKGLRAPCRQNRAGLVAPGQAAHELHIGHLVSRPVPAKTFKRLDPWVLSGPLRQGLAACRGVTCGGQHGGGPMACPPVLRAGNRAQV